MPERPSAQGKWLGQWRTLALFWAVVLGVLAAGGVTLQVLGPPGTRPAARVAVVRPTPGGAALPGRAAASPTGGANPAAVADLIAAPDPALLEHRQADASGDAAATDASGDAAGVGLPRIAPDGRTPMRTYAAHFNAATKTPRIAILIAGIGLDETASEAAIHALPAAVTLAISPYATKPDAAAAAARRAGDETLVSLPLEPQGYALNDPGPRALLTSAAPEENARQLDWVLSRFAGYVGATGALGDMHGERFAAVPDQMDAVLATLAARGLLYVDPRPGAARLRQVWSRTIDVVIDDPPDAASIDAHLAELEKRAHDTGAALGLIGSIRPVTLEHLIAWVGNLAGRGYMLAPISAIVIAPAGKLSPKVSP